MGDELRLDVAAIAPVARPAAAAWLLEHGFHQVCPTCEPAWVTGAFDRDPCPVCDGVGIEDVPGYWVDQWVAWCLDHRNLTALCHQLTGLGLLAFRVWSETNHAINIVVPLADIWKGMCLPGGQAYATLADLDGDRHVLKVLGQEAHRDLEAWRTAVHLDLAEGRGGLLVSPPVTLPATDHTWCIAVGDHPDRRLDDSIHSFTVPYEPEHTLAAADMDAHLTLTCPPLDHDDGSRLVRWVAVSTYPSRGQLEFMKDGEGSVLVPVEAAP